ncbi:MAG: hypothetical protein DPW11_01375 [bacterium]|nr:TrmB family transcriptional regulator [Candidatus Microgenomates bacterium CPR3]MCQ3944412.1 hypothetical protein [bacterium]RIK52189.1 MAG: hypothetical protein DCC61_00170 [Candidatus Microgenomates bacterium]
MDYQKRTIDVLKNFGLSDNEALVYQKAVELGETSPFKISKATGIARTTVYAVLTDLSLKGLVELESATGLMKQQTKVIAKNPSILREIIHSKQKSLSTQEVDIVEILPWLKKEYLKDTTDSDFQFFPGMEGANYVMFDYDGVDQDSYIFDYQVPMDATGGKEMNKGVDRGIKKRVGGVGIEYNLTPMTDWTKHVLSYQVERNPHYLDRAQFRYPPFELQNFNVMVRLKGNRTWIVSVKDKEVWGIKIRSSNLTTSLICLHQALWKISSPITKDMIESWMPNPYLQAEKSNS